jgi:predicted PurR-regulated permease PerM
MNPHTIRWVFIITLFVVFLVLAITWSGVLLPFIIGLVIAYLLDPLIFFVQQKLRMRRLPALGVVFMLFLAFFVLMIISLYPVFALGVTSLSETIGNNKEAIGGFAQGAIDWFEDLSLPIDKDAIKSGLFSKLESFMTQLFGGISSFVLSVIESIPLLILIPLIVFYFLKDKDRIFAVLKRYTRDENELRIRALFESIDVRLGGYIKGQFILSAVVTLITFAGLLIFDIPYAFLIALANGVLNIIP